MASLNGKTGLVMFTGGALVIANAWKAGTIQALAQGQIATDSTPGHSWYQTPWGQIGYESLGVLVATVIANADDEAGSVILAFFGILWLLFLMTKLGQPTQKATVPAAGGNAPSPATVTSGGITGGATLPGWTSPSGHATTLPSNPGGPGANFHIKGQPYIPGNPNNLPYPNILNP